MMKTRSGSLTGMQMSVEILRPFLFFINYLAVRRGRIGARDRDCMMSCFRIVLEDITSNGMLLLQYSTFVLRLLMVERRGLSLSSAVF